MTDSSSLKPCPNCHGPATMQVGPDENGQLEVWLGCESCDSGLALIGGDVEGMKAKAIEVWQEMLP